MSDWKIEGLQVIGSDAARILAEAHIKAVVIECMTVIGLVAVFGAVFLIAVHRD